MKEFDANNSNSKTGAMRPSTLRIGVAEEPWPVRVKLGKRAGRMRHAVRDGLRRWSQTRPSSAQHAQLLAGVEPPNEIDPDVCVRQLPRRHEIIDTKNVEAGPPMMRRLEFKIKYRKVLERLIYISGALIYWYACKFMDKLLRKGADEIRAKRLRAIIEWIGGTAVKLGQQMSMRIDLMPYVYGVELSNMLDNMEPFPTAYAIERIEHQLKRPLNEVFSAFDPKPIGSASIACVYQAVLKSGEHVAVKVRRPNIGEVFVAECEAFAWVFSLLETLTLIHPGLSHNFLFEFRTMLIEELNFIKEARHTELFRRRARKNLHRVTAPRVFFELSGEDVLTTEFVSGIWLKEIIAAIEQNDKQALAYLSEHNIDAKVVAKRLVRTNQFGIFENLLFHADPHPSNVLVQPDNKLVFIDFGSCGAYTTKERNNWRQLAYYQSKEDVGRMVQSALAVLEPLPPIDIDEFTKRLEAVFWEDLYAFKSKHYQWYERTSARIWISFLNLAREYNVAMNLNTLRMIRSTLLYETVAARLYNKIDAYREHRKYNKSAGKRARKRVRRAVHKRLFGGLTDTDYLRVEQAFGMGNRILYLLQRHLDTPPFRFSLLISKAVYAMTMVFRLLLISFFTTLTLAFGFVLYRTFLSPAHASQSLWNVFIEILSSGYYQFVILGAVWLFIRRILFRFWDKEIRRDNASGLS